MSYYGAPIARQGSIAPATYGRPSFAAPAYGAYAGNCGPCGVAPRTTGARYGAPAYGAQYGQYRYAPRYIEDDYYYYSEEVRPAPRRRARKERNVRPAGSRRSSRRSSRK